MSQSQTLPMKQMRMHSGDPLRDSFRRLSRSSSVTTDLGYHTLSPSQSQTSTNGYLSTYNSMTTNSRKGIKKGSGSAMSTLSKSGYRATSSLTRPPPVSKIQFEELPDQVILKIFSKLSANELCYSCARVSRRWYYLTWEPKLWQNLVFNSSSLRMDVALRSLMKLLSREVYCSQNVPSVSDSVSSSSNPSEHYFQRSTSQSLSIHHINLNSCLYATDKSLLLVAKKCQELKTLVLRNCTTITDLGLNQILTSCPNLEKLDLLGCSNIRLNITRLPEHSSKLHHLDVSHCLYINDHSLKAFLKLYGQQLTHFYVRRCLLLSDQSAKLIGNHCPSLKELSICDCPQMTDYFCRDLGQKLGSNLKYLSLAKCEQITDAGVLQLAMYCYKLRYLNVRGCFNISDDGIVAIIRSCGIRLKSLDIGKCDVSDEALQALSENCPNLRKLSVADCYLVSNIGINLIAYYCRGIILINMTNCPNVTVDSFRYVKRFCKKCHLQHNNPTFY